MKPTPVERDNLTRDLVAARLRAGVLQVHIARRMCVHRSYIWGIENGGKAPSAAMLGAYAELCGLDKDALCAAWGLTPHDVDLKVTSSPHLWNAIRSL